MWLPNIFSFSPSLQRDLATHHNFFLSFTIQISDEILIWIKEAERATALNRFMLCSRFGNSWRHISDASKYLHEPTGALFKEGFLWGGETKTNMGVWWTLFNDKLLGIEILLALNGMNRLVLNKSRLGLKLIKNTYQSSATFVLIPTKSQQQTQYWLTSLSEL